MKSDISSLSRLIRAIGAVAIMGGVVSMAWLGSSLAAGTAACGTPSPSPSPSPLIPSLPPIPLPVPVPLLSPSPSPTPTQTEYVGNPGFERTTNGWQPSGTGVTLARVAGGHTGDWSAQLRNDGTAPTTVTLNDSPNWVDPSDVGTFTGSAWVRGDADGPSVKIRLREFQGTSLVGFSVADSVLSTDWQKISVQYTPTAACSSTLDFTVYVTSTAVGSSFFVDDLSILR